MSIVQFYFVFPALFMLHELEEIVWMPSFVKKISIQYPNNRILSYYTPFAFNFIVLEQFLILMTSLYLSYQFNNYTIYATIIIAYIFHVFGHLIQTIIIRKYVDGNSNEFVYSMQSQKWISNHTLWLLSIYLIGYRFKSCSVIYDS